MIGEKGAPLVISLGECEWLVSLRAKTGETKKSGKGKRMESLKGKRKEKLGRGDVAVLSVRKSVVRGPAE